MANSMEEMNFLFNDNELKVKELRVASGFHIG